LKLDDVAVLLDPCTDGNAGRGSCRSGEEEAFNHVSV